LGPIDRASSYLCTEESTKGKIYLNKTQHNPFAEVKTKVLNTTLFRPCAYGHAKSIGQGA
jgi:hypothetical protein